MEPVSLISALFIIFLIGFFAWVAWQFLPWDWAKYLVGGTLAIVAVYKFVMLALTLI